MPVLAPALDEPFYITVFARIMIWAIAAVSLNLILGYGGMVSFGHACYLGIGGYVVGIMAFHGVTNGFIQWPLALLASGLAALVFGAICLRTRGVYFIMITLAFAQMIYYLSISVEKYGSDDGLTIDFRSEFGGLIDLEERTVIYYVIFFCLVGSLYLVHRVVNSRFGMVVRGSKSNDARMHAIGHPTYRYRLACFVIAGMICGLAGILQANLEKFVSPDMMYWPRSGELIFMVVLGGMGTLFGPVAGALVFLLLADTLSGFTEHWHIIFGPFLILVVLFVHGGIDGLLGRREAAGG
ncbi:MAG: branched-chain amino acid ABC transporter permease [Alphaproteobacteria bacterium]|nr:branched-chain amino acid ABC transporter permease [Alphaproteobacteria bacterium]